MGRCATFSALVCLLLLAVFSRLWGGDEEKLDPDYRHAPRQAYEAWRDLKYGLRIHWGTYSMLGVEASWELTRQDRPWQEMYHNLYKKFNPDAFSGDEWADMMVRNGFKFFVFTTKHHDGFSMYDTRTKVKRRFVYTGPNAGGIEKCDIHYSIMETPFGRDVVKELVDACRKRGLAIGLYFSHIDWYDADFRLDRWNPNRDRDYSKKTDPDGWARFVKRHREQIRELLTGYGKINMLSLDMSFPPQAWPEVKETVKMARNLQPECLFRHRGIGAYGDYQTPENWIPARPGQEDEKVNNPWQVIHVLGRTFAYDPVAENYRSGEWIVSTLIDIVSKGGNFMVSIGPNARGKFHPRAIEKLEYAGNWLRVNGEAIYATRPWFHYKEGDAIRFTRSKDTRFVYAISLKWPGRELALKSVKALDGSKILMLGLDEPLTWRNAHPKGLVIDIPEEVQAEEKRPCRQAYVFKIEWMPNKRLEANAR